MGLVLDLLYLCLAVVASPWIVFRLTRTRGWSTLPLRAGRGLPRDARGGVWLHASSVGEVALLKPLIRLIEAMDPALPIIVSTFTRTGYEAARASYSTHHVVYFPLDLTFVVSAFLSSLAPRLVVIVESELWPNFLRAARARRIDVAVLNGKMSARSYRVHKRLGLVPLRDLSLVAVQNAEHAERFRALGVPDARLFVTGNMKYDLAAQPAGRESRASLRATLGYGEDDVVVIGGSLHPGEERSLLDAHRRLAEAGDAAALILVPRYPEHGPAVVEEARRTGRPAVLQTEIDSRLAAAPGPNGVLVVDVIGRLGRLYSAADIAFVGGSLFYRGAGKGGHNLMEPAVLGVPVMFGPYNVSFKDTVADLLAENAAVCVSGVDDLVAALQLWLRDPAARAAVGEHGKRVIMRGQGATRRNFDLLLELPCMAEARLQGSPDPSTMPPAAGDSKIR